MYLARRTIDHRTHYFLRQSYLQGETWLSRELVALGPQPWTLIHYRDRNLFTIDEWVDHQLQQLDIEYNHHELERLFLRFLTPAAREVIERAERRSPLRLVSREELARIDQQVHIFDRRRLSGLRFGVVDHQRLYRLSPKLCRVILDMSRDQKEQYFWDQEEILEAAEHKEYVYNIFNLQAHFSQSFLRNVPQALPQDQLDNIFGEEICALQRDRKFWAGMEVGEYLHFYLRRYLIMYFDGFWREHSTWAEYVRQFMDEHRQYRPPISQQQKMHEAAKLFGISWEELRNLDRRSLAKLYRHRAHDLHPDKGGNAEQFATLTEIYRHLLKRKS